MPFFEYRGKCSSGTAITGRIEASDHDDAMMQLNGMGLQSIELEVSSPRSCEKWRREFALFSPYNKGQQFTAFGCRSRCFATRRCGWR